MLKPLHEAKKEDLEEDKGEKMFGGYVKAFFKLCDDDGKEKGEKLVVLINPSEITVEVSTKMRDKDGTNRTDGGQPPPTLNEASHPSKTMQMTLYFDLVNQYEIDREVSILSSSCLKTLEEAANTSKLLMFIWGGISFLGKFTSFNSKYTYFSNQGVPLRAELSVSMEAESGNNDALKTINTEVDLTPDLVRPTTV